MPNYVEITTYFEERRKNALEAAIKEATGETLTEKLLEALGDLYREYVPDDQRADIDAKIAADEVREKTEMEANRTFAVYHIHEGGEDALFRSDIFDNAMQAAYRYRLYQRGELHDQPATFAAAFVDAEPITPQEFAAACDDMNSDKRITAIFEFNLDGGTFSICDSSDNAWNTYRLHDVSVAAFKAQRSNFRATAARREIFNDSLVGKEIVFDEGGEETPTEDDGEEVAPTMQM